MKVTLTIEGPRTRSESFEVDAPDATMALPLVFRAVHMAMAGRAGEIESIRAALQHIGQLFALAAPTADDECTHGADCAVHPNANSLHNFDSVAGQ